MSYLKAYDISLVDNVPYPYEQYQSAVDNNFFFLTSRDYIFTNIIRYQKRPTNEILSFLNEDIINPKSANAILYYDLVTNNSFLSANDRFANQPNDINRKIFYAEKVPTININTNSTIYFNISSLRQRYKTPQEFQVFYIQNDPNVNDNYGYLLYPNRLFLNPTGIYKNPSTGNWSLTTKTNIIAWSAIFISSDNIESEAYPIHRKYLSNIPPLSSLDDLSDPSYTLNYSICASRTRMNVKVLPQQFSAGYNPSIYSIQFENDKVAINPDSTFLTYSARFVNPNNNIITISQQYPYSYTTNNSYTFTTSYVINYKPTVNANQTFQLIQYPTFTNKALGDESNAIAKCTVDLSTSKLTYTNVSTTGAPNSNIYFDYIADAININGSPAIGTINSINIDSAPYTINTNVLATTVSDNDMVWDSTYPPHYYTYKTKLQNAAGNYLDSFNLNFYLKTSALNTQAVDGESYTLELKLSSIIVSDYNALVYDLYNHTKSNEKIKYTITNISNPTVIPTLSAQYGPAGVNYNLTTSPWIDVKAGSYLKIYYPPQFGEIELSIRASLQGDYGILDAFEDTSAVLARQYSDSNNGTSLSLNVIAEESNLIKVDSSFNVDSVGWPSRDLTNSKIVWSVSPYESFVKIYSIDENSKFIRFIDNGEVLDFDESTYTIAVSGYGPEQTVISLSSQKYDEVASVRTNTTLFDYFGENKFSVTPKIPLNNLNRVRTIDLKLQVPYQGRLYDIPAFLNTPIYWTWTYDDITDPLMQPVSAYQPLNNNSVYDYAESTNYSLLSAIRISVLPELNNTPTLHKVTVTANSDIRFPTITGAFTFDVDAFPDKSLLNCDFKTYYKNYSSIEIGDTYNGLNTITRAASGDLSFLLVDDSEFLSKIKYKNKTWMLNDTVYNTQNHIINVDSNVVGLSTYKITLKLDSAIAQGWTSAHNVSAEEYFYAIDPLEFYNPLEFILYPEYAWIGNTETLTFLTSSNYTLSFRPSAYANKRNNSQAFWLSANKGIYNVYNYTNLNNSYTSALSSNFGLMDILYDVNDISVYTGIPIYLECYNNTTYPKIMGTTYYAFSGSSFKLLNFTNFKQSKEFNDNNVSDFTLSPTIIPYNDLVLLYKIDTKVINLDVSRNVTITQTISTRPANGPASVVGGTVTYYLSSRFWTVTSVIPAVDGVYNIFSLNYGDPAIPLFSGENGIDRYYLSAKTDVVQQIPFTTFPVGSSDYSGNTDLWSPITL
jgi:hypothetical protein